MDETQNAVSYQGSGQIPEPTVQQPAPAQGEETKQFVKVEDAKKAFREILQSFLDKDETRAIKRVQSKINDLEQRWNVLAQAGLPLSDDEKKAEKLIEARKVLSEVESADTTGANQQAQQYDPINAQVEAYESKYGVKLEEGDPELALIKRYPAPLSEFFDTTQQALAAKVKRIALQVNPPTHTPTNLGTGAPMASTSTRIEVLTSQMETLMKEPSKNRVEINRLREELDKLIK